MLGKRNTMAFMITVQSFYLLSTLLHPMHNFHRMQRELDDVMHLQMVNVLELGTVCLLLLINIYIHSDCGAEARWHLWPMGLQVSHCGERRNWVIRRFSYIESRQPSGVSSNQMLSKY